MKRIHTMSTETEINPADYQLHEGDTGSADFQIALLTKRMNSEGINLHDISEKLGYLYYSHFCTDVKKFFGISPKQLERKLRPE